MATAKKLDNDGRDWYELNGTDNGTGVIFENEIYSVTDNGSILDCGGCPLTEGDWRTIAIKNTIKQNHNGTNMHTHTCLRCGLTWSSKLEQPRVCPRCKSYYWQEPRKRETEDKKEG